VSFHGGPDLTKGAYLFKSGFRLKRENQVPEAITQYRACIAKNPKHTKALYNLASLLASRKGDVDEAEAMFRQAIMVDPTFVDAHFNLGNLLEEQKFDLEGAETSYREVLKLDSTFWPAMFNLATLISGDHTKEYAEAENWCVSHTSEECFNFSLHQIFKSGLLYMSQLFATSNSLHRICPRTGF
jgi:tetratricopeptide (TPR) repeat protein